MSTIPIENFMCICCSNLIRISNYWWFLLLYSCWFTCILSFAGNDKVCFYITHFFIFKVIWDRNSAVNKSYDNCISAFFLLRFFPNALFPRALFSACAFSCALFPVRFFPIKGYLSLISSKKLRNCNNILCN